MRIGNINDFVRSMNAQQELRAAHSLNAWILERLDEIEFSCADREFLSALCFDMVIEHHAAVSVLIGNNMYGTAFSVPRLLLDSFVRGCWLLHCASDKQVSDYKNDKHDVPFGKLIEELEETEGFKERVLSRLKVNSWNAMNSYAHSGIAQLSRRVRGDEITPNYSDEEIVEVLKLCGTFALMAFQHLSFLAYRTDLSEEALRLLTEGGPLQ